MEADAHLDAPVGCFGGVALHQCRLNLDGAAHRLQGAGELHQETVASALDLAPAVLDEEPPQLALMLGQQSERQRFVPLRQGAVADHVGEHDGREPAFAVDRHVLP